MIVGTYNVIPLAGNGLNAAGTTLTNGLSALDEAAEGFLGWLTGDPQLAQGLNNATAVMPIGWPEDAAKLSKLAKGLAQCAKRAAKALPTPKVADPKLGNIVNDLYKGAKGPNPLGIGSTADAVRNELSTGLPNRCRRRRNSESSSSPMTRASIFFI